MGEKTGSSGMTPEIEHTREVIFNLLSACERSGKKRTRDLSTAAKRDRQRERGTRGRTDRERGRGRRRRGGAGGVGREREKVEIGRGRRKKLQGERKREGDLGEVCSRESRRRKGRRRRAWLKDF